MNSCLQVVETEKVKRTRLQKCREKFWVLMDIFIFLIIVINSHINMYVWKYILYFK